MANGSAGTRKVSKQPNPPTKARPGVTQQRQTICAAAVVLFVERGVSVVSVSEICRQAGVSRDTFYRCFTDKEALISHFYQTSVNEHIERVVDSWRLDYSNPVWLHEVFDQTIDAILHEHTVAQFLFVESADPRSPAYKVIHKAYTHAVKQMQGWCRKNGNEVPSNELLFSLLVAAQWLVHNAIVEGMKPRHIARAKAASEQLFFAVFSTLTSNRTSDPTSNPTKGAQQALAARASPSQ